MAQYRASESKRERFRRYLERSGLLDNLTSVLVELYEESDKPDNPLERTSAQRVLIQRSPATSSRNWLNYSRDVTSSWRRTKHLKTSFCSMNQRLKGEQRSKECFPTQEGTTDT
ncbi:uncharacterized protein LOC130128783 isoform X1 [Lampris incognitus]|uniref:uncharacterized protein LOC130128783 isoform X1 n=1 Tax=Lampris incognitus TaxID=2546036 RepID=UPI0024B52360|nr:uncharacterized protein LOC130128783 isoform X1 [Lampris incognitus]